MASNSFLSTFSGAGGLDIGLEKAGWVCRYASDIDPCAMDTLEENQRRGRLPASRSRILADAFLETADIRQTFGSDVLAKAGTRRGDIALLAGGPPCQSWSSAGHQHGFQDPRGRLFSDFIRLADELDVRWLLFENVRGLLTARGPDGVPGSALHTIRASLLRVGFQTAVALLNAADYGVPQRRVRLFVIGYRMGDAPPFADPTHTKYCDLADGRRKPWVTLGDCLRALRSPTGDEIIRPSGKLARELAAVPPGSGVKSPGKPESTRPGGHWGYKQGAFVADLDLPARTVTASSQQDWVRDPEFGLRRLCPRECAAIQSFPASWKFVGNRATQYRLIGNAVPPTLAAAIGRSLLKHSMHGPLPEQVLHLELLPLAPHLAAAIKYTVKEEMRNGASRRFAPPKRISNVADL